MTVPPDDRSTPGLPPWPKGPFPRRYLARAVVSRLSGAWDAGDPALLASADERLRAIGLLPRPRPDDALLRVVSGAAELTAARDALAGLALSAFRWRAGGRDDRDRRGSGIGLVPSEDPVDALVVVGTASPEDGIGTAAMVRFVTTLRGMCTTASIDGLAEDAIELAVVPKSDLAALRIAARARELCAPLARLDTSADALAERVVREEALSLSWRRDGT